MPVPGHLAKFLSTPCPRKFATATQRMRGACRGWRRDMGTGGNERCIGASEGNTCAPDRHTGRARWISPISSWIHAWSWPPHELASFPACDGLMGGTKHTQVGVCRGAGIRGTGGWMLALLARLIGSPVPAWAQTVPILDERMHPHLLRVRLVFPCRPLPPCFAWHLASKHTDLLRIRNSKKKVRLKELKSLHTYLLLLTLRA